MKDHGMQMREPNIFCIETNKMHRIKKKKKFKERLIIHPVLIPGLKLLFPERNDHNPKKMDENITDHNPGSECLNVHLHR
jgi:hypothetical protein